MSVGAGLTIEPIIGLEVHVQLMTRTKLWCGCPLEFGAPPNSRVCPVCLGLPGALPVLNRAALEYALRAALALHCRIAKRCQWDRKSYYYPDLPKNYQISQFDLPLAEAGYFEFPCAGRIRRVRIERAHLEEDAGRNVHDLPEGTGVDLNRAGIPLLEIVTAPDLHAAEEARECAVQLQRLVRYLGVSEANMQRGQMRFEPNINVRIRKAEREFPTPIAEVKNLNSFRALGGAIRFEIERQVSHWMKDGVTAARGNKSNRGWNDERGATVAQRGKEEAHDYRYFPDPDLVPFEPDPAWVARLRTAMPELPIPRTLRFVSEYAVPANNAPALVDDRATADLLDAAADAGGDKLILARQFLSFWARQANERGTTIAALGIPASHLAELSQLVSDGRINATAAAQIAREMTNAADGIETEAPKCAAPSVLAERLGLYQSSDEDEIAVWVAEVLAANGKAVRDALLTPAKSQVARAFLVGQVMKLSAGKADPEIAMSIIVARLEEIRDE